jgi:hypothetical protein
MGFGVATPRHEMLLSILFGAHGSLVVKALCYKPEGSIPDEVNFKIKEKLYFMETECASCEVRTGL